MRLSALCRGRLRDHQRLAFRHIHDGPVACLRWHHVVGGSGRRGRHLRAKKANRHDLVDVFRVLIGVLLTYVLSIALAPLLAQSFNAPVIQLLIALILCYICTSVLLQTKDDFRFLIPYVEFVREVKGFKPLVLDTSVVIDGRIADLVSTGVFDNQLIMPRFALSELQAIADSSDKLRRTRGRRGLDVLNRMRADENVDLMIFDRDLPELAGQTVDLKLVLLAKHLEGKVVTGDFNLNKVAKLHNVAGDQLERDQQFAASGFLAR